MTRRPRSRIDLTQSRAALVRSTARQLMGLLRARDAYTARHAQRVAIYAVAVARHLGLAGDLVNQIRLAALLHDIGKLIVDEELLTRRGPLNDREHRQVLEHAVLGERMLELMLRHWPAALAAVRSHHERVDGGGFPDQLQGEGIPLAARIIGVADAFDAMTSSRPYRSALPPAAAVREIEREAGSQFDPACVTSFVSILRSVAQRAVLTLRVGAVFLASKVHHHGGTGVPGQRRVDNTGAHPPGLPSRFVGAAYSRTSTARAPPGRPRAWGPRRILGTGGADRGGKRATSLALRTL